jgi:hypothetical protein
MIKFLNVLAIGLILTLVVGSLAHAGVSPP